MIIQGSTHYINTWRKKEKQYVMATFLRKKISLPQPFFSLAQNRIYYMLAWNNEEGRQKGASHQLIDAIIKENAGKDIWLDFEGSDIPGIAFFFEGFGAQPEYYYYLRENRLPRWCRWMKE